MKQITACGIALAGLLAAGLAGGQDSDHQAQQEKIRRYLALEKDILQAFREKEYDKAVAACKAQNALLPKLPGPHYNLTCALARLGKLEDALTALGKSIELGYNDPAHMREDGDLASLHGNKRFEELLAKARENEKQGPFDKGAEIRGVKTIEGFPEGGLRYRLRMAQSASKEKPNRLVIWLHPSGGSMNSVVEGMSPGLAERGFALLVVTQKQWFGWNEEEAKRLFEKTLPEVAHIEGIDAGRPILMGFSAGGQMALELWQKSPGDFGGLVLDAAYPVEREAADSTVRLRPMDLPKGQAIKQTPIFAIVGQSDQGGAAVATWKQASAKWLPAGVPLMLHLVPNKGHQWLFDQQQTAVLHEWLSQVAAGNLPADKPQ
jgi:predicted esterase